MIVKKIIPANIRLAGRLLQRRFIDFTKGYSKQFAKNNECPIELNHSISVTQNIKSGSYTENKIHNIKLAANRIGKLIIFPDEVFSFWKIVGKPSKRNGYKKGRNLIAGKIMEEYGGGLCQLSGIIYHLSIIAGLKTLERYNHTLDIYTDETRFTPLGTDATIVYGYKDLRFKNTSSHPINLTFKISEKHIKGSLYSNHPLKKRAFLFEKYSYDHTLKVTVIDSSDNSIVNKSYYKIDQSQINL